MIKTDLKLSSWVSLIVTMAIGTIAIFVYYNTKEQLKSGEIVLTSINQKLLYTLGLGVLFYVIDGNVFKRIKNLQSVDYLAIFVLLSGLFWVWAP
jgi:predicted membrane channel-forming protein YqfA (hemolysin III family)